MMMPGMPGMFRAPVPMMPQYPVNPQQAMFPQQQLIEQMQSLSLGGPRPGGGVQNKQKRKETMNKFPSLYVGNLPKENFFDLDFFKFFTNKGYNVKSAKVVLDSKTQKSRGYGYLQFVTKADADKCRDAMNNFMFHN